ncbi:MAG: type II toxin-antitoxin system VapC family toxin [Candidatus Thermoplasmatota archaeon]|jgi:predicted nucleic acid-binding protein|nr:type II toxin-antitoxin system VapC family toxin [Candidatus Thermoplasmatota archaeon]MDP7265463.1 type II toxin-antitoxin system VapC family toxin [Candidatus Thermoplasmatota archaeon]
MVCLDTTFIIDLMREKKSGIKGPASLKLMELMDRKEVPKTSIITVSELYVGPYRVEDARELEKVERIVEEMDVLNITIGTVKRFGKIVAKLYRAGKPIGVMDAFIAAIAVENGEELVSRNTKNFENVPGLRLETY